MDKRRKRDLSTNMNIRLPKGGKRVIKERSGSFQDEFRNLRERVKMIEGQMDKISKAFLVILEKSSESVINFHLEDIKTKFKEEIDKYIENYFTNHLTEILNMIKFSESKFKVKIQKALTNFGRTWTTGYQCWR
jgi:fructose-1,6-bisphosphatase